MAEKNRTWVHPNAISYDSEGLERPLHYYRHWQHLDFVFEDYKVTRVILSQNADNIVEDVKFNRVARKLSEHGFDAMSKEEQQAFADHQLGYVQNADETDGLRIEGWARIDGVGTRRISAFSVHDKNKTYKEYEEYDRTFERVKVNVRSSKEDTLGSLFLWTRDLRHYDDAPDDPDEDYLVAEFHVAKPRLAQFVEDLMALPTKPPLALHAQALLFQSEVDASLSEPWHPQDFAFIHEESAPIILNRIFYPLISKGVPADERDVDKGFLERLVEPAALPDKGGDAKPRADVVKQMLGVKCALWVLAAAVVLAALITA